MPLAFRQGMARCADILGDVDQWAPNTWQGALGRKHIHVLIAAFCMDGDVNDYWREIRTRLEPEANPVGPDFIGRFSDGVGQPDIEGVGLPQPCSKKNVVAAGEFVLGYPDWMETTRLQPILSARLFAIFAPTEPTWCSQDRAGSRSVHGRSCNVRAAFGR